MEVVVAVERARFVVDDEPIAASRECLGAMVFVVWSQDDHSAVRPVDQNRTLTCDVIKVDGRILIKGKRGHGLLLET